LEVSSRSPFLYIHIVLFTVLYLYKNQGRSQGGALGARAPPLEKKCLEGSKGLKNYSQDQRFSPLAGTPLRKFLATPLTKTLNVSYSDIVRWKRLIKLDCVENIKQNELRLKTKFNFTVFVSMKKHVYFAFRRIWFVKPIQTRWKLYKSIEK